MKRTLAACLGAALSLAASTSRAQTADPDDAATGDEPRTPPKKDGAPSSSTAFRLAAVGSYRSIYDLSLVGGGGSLAIEGTGPLAGGFDAQFFLGRSFGGLSFTDGRAMGTLGGLLAPGLRLTGGLGLEVVTITRATDGSLLVSAGAAGMARLQYDFERGSGVFLKADFDVYLGSAVIWGPTVGVGYRF
jgi:hypothetical protein